MYSPNVEVFDKLIFKQDPKNEYQLDLFMRKKMELVNLAKIATFMAFLSLWSRYLTHLCISIWEKRDIWAVWSKEHIVWETQMYEIDWFIFPNE